MLEVGEKAPLDAVVWTTPRERAGIGELVHERRSSSSSISSTGQKVNGTNEAFRRVERRDRLPDVPYG
jgi:hypothetical protein